MERRAKQAAFAAKQAAASDVAAAAVVVCERALHVRTFARSRSGAVATQHTFDVSEVLVDEPFSMSVSGLDADVQQAVLAKPQFARLLLAFARKIEAHDWTDVGICCNHGRHRSVALAEGMRRLYPNMTCEHLEL